MHTALPAKTVAENKVVTFDFSNVASLPITGPSVTKATIVGTDPSAAGLTLGTATPISSSVLLLVSGGIEDCSYLLVCSVTDASAQVHQVGATLTTTLSAI